MNGKILVTPRSVTRDGHPALDRLAGAGFVPVFCTPGRQPDEEELIRLVPECVGYLAGVEKITARVIDAADSLRVISRNGTGVDAVDTAAASAKGIVVCRALGANARGVAELAFGHLLSLARWIPFSDAGIKAGEWDRRKGIEFQGRTLGIVGCGAIGRMVAHFASAFGMRVLGHDPYPDAALEKIPGFSFVSCDQALCAAARIPNLVPHHFGMFGFNTVDEDDLRRKTLLCRDVNCMVPDTTSVVAVERPVQTAERSTR